MKKTCIILSFVLFGLCLTGFSQEVRVGISGGLTISDITGPDNGMNHGVKTGFIAGLLLDVPLGSNFSFQPQLNYVQKGNLLMEDANQKVYNALRYAELPMNFLYNFNSGKVTFFLGAGPSLSFNVPSKRVTKPKEGESFYSDILFGDTPENDFRGIDWGVNFTGGLKFSQRIFLAGFYNMGLRDINPRTDGSSSTSIKNKCFGIQIGYIFNN